MAEIKIFNKMEPVVERTAEEIFNKEKSQCVCSRCQMDIIALALNSLPPKYVVTELGDVVTNVDLASSQWRVDVMMAIYRSMEIVREQPRH